MSINQKTAPLLLGLALCLLGFPPQAVSGDAPQWMHALVNVPLPAHDEKTDAVMLYSEENLNVLSADKIKKVVRVAYKILRPGGRDYGMVAIPFNSNAKITSLRGWCIPAQGKDYEIKDKEALEVSLSKIDGSELISDVKQKLLRIPASDPGNIVGYQYEVEEHPLVLQEIWHFQGQIPVRESHYTLQLPSHWEYKASWLNYPASQPTQGGSSQWQWVVNDLKEIREEDDIAPMSARGRWSSPSFRPGGRPRMDFPVGQRWEIGTGISPVGGVTLQPRSSRKSVR